MAVSASMASYTRRVPLSRVVLSRLSCGLARVGRCIHGCRRVYQTRGFRQLEQNPRTASWVGDGHKNLGRRSTRRNFTTQALLVPQDADVTLALTDGFISASLSLTIRGG